MFAPTSNSERELLQRISEGDETAFSQLFYGYHQQVGIFIYKITGSRAQTEELVQDIFMKVWTNRIFLPEVKDFPSWLFAISKNHALNSLKRIINEREQYLRWEKQQHVTIGHDDLSREDQYQLIDQAIGQLPPQQKRVFLLSRYRKLKYDEIARELNLSRETVKSYLRLATSSISRYVTNRFSQVIALLAFLYN